MSTDNVLSTRSGRKIPRPTVTQNTVLGTAEFEERVVPTKSPDQILDWTEAYGRLDDIFYNSRGKLLYFTLTSGEEVYPRDTLKRRKSDNTFTVVRVSQT